MCWCWWEILMPTQPQEHFSLCGVILMRSTIPSPLEAWTISLRTLLVSGFSVFFSPRIPEEENCYWMLLTCIDISPSLKMKIGINLTFCWHFADQFLPISCQSSRLARAMSCWARRSAQEAATTKRSRPSSAWETRHLPQEKRRSPCAIGWAEDANFIPFFWMIVPLGCSPKMWKSDEMGSRTLLWKKTYMIYIYIYIYMRYIYNIYIYILWRTYTWAY